MTQLVHETASSVLTASSAPRAAGVAFVPCAICLAPVDLASVADGGVQLCTRHGATDYISLN